MSAERDPMTPELRRLLDAEAARPDPTAAEREHVRQQIEARLNHLGASASHRRWVRSPRLWTVLAVAGGAALVFKAGHFTRPLLPKRGEEVSFSRSAPAPVAPVEAVAPVQPTVAAEAPPAPPAPAETRAQEPASPVPSGSRRTLAGPAPAQPLEDSLARERSLIERARAQLRSLHPGAALGLLHEHERAFPSGILVEERLGLQIEALIANGQLEDARRRAASFRARFPRSPLLPGLDAALQRGSL